MSRALALGAASALLGSCGGPSLMTVDRYLSQCSAVQGKPVRLAGYLGNCGGNDCALYANKAQAQTSMRYYQTLRELAKLADHKERVAKNATLERPPTSIGVGWVDGFDQKAQPFLNSYVVVSGRVHDDDCIGQGTDRSWGVMPTDIRAWTVSEGAPQNTN